MCLALKQPKTVVKAMPFDSIRAYFTKPIKIERFSIFSFKKKKEILTSKFKFKCKTQHSQSNPSTVTLFVRNCSFQSIPFIHSFLTFNYWRCENCARYKHAYVYRVVQSWVYWNTGSIAKRCFEGKCCRLIRDESDAIMQIKLISRNQSFWAC